MHVVEHTETRSAEIGLDIVTAEFAGQIAVAVWLGNLTDEAACEALWCYALACDRRARTQAAAVFAALMSEYRFRREWQDACE